MYTRPEIISARWIIPVEPANTVLEHHSVVSIDGVIKEICPTRNAIEHYPQANQIECNNHVLIPGLINAHTHAAMCLFRGLADDLSLTDWLTKHVWPAEAKWVNPDFVREGTQLAIAEMLTSGTTCFNDMYYFPDLVANLAQDTGIRATVGIIVLSFPTIWADTTEEYFRRGMEVHDETRALSHIQTALAPHAPYMLSDEPLHQVRTYADELQIPIHIHVHETKQEISDSLSLHGQRPLSRLHSIGLLNPRMIAVHMTQLTDEEIALAAEQGIHIVHCPESNQKMASGNCRVGDLLEAGVNVCLGTDGACSNNDLDMLSEMRSAALMAKNMSGDASILPAWQALQMATLNAAKALNMEDEIGSLTVGKSTDMVAVDLNKISSQPVFNPISQLVYCASREQVTDVWVNGRRLLDNKNLTTINTDQTLQIARSWGRKIAQS